MSGKLIAYYFLFAIVSISNYIPNSSAVFSGIPNSVLYAADEIADNFLDAIGNGTQGVNIFYEKLEKLIGETSNNQSATLSGQNLTELFEISLLEFQECLRITVSSISQYAGDSCAAANITTGQKEVLDHVNQAFISLVKAVELAKTGDNTKNEAIIKEYQNSTDTELLALAVTLFDVIRNCSDSDKTTVETLITSIQEKVAERLLDMSKATYTAVTLYGELASTTLDPNAPAILITIEIYWSDSIRNISDALRSTFALYETFVINSYLNHTIDIINIYEIRYARKVVSAYLVDATNLLFDLITSGLNGIGLVSNSTINIVDTMEDLVVEKYQNAFAAHFEIVRFTRSKFSIKVEVLEAILPDILRLFVREYLYVIYITTYDISVCTQFLLSMNAIEEIQGITGKFIVEVLFTLYGNNGTIVDEIRENILEAQESATTQLKIVNGHVFSAVKILAEYYCSTNTTTINDGLAKVTGYRKLASIANRRQSKFMAVPDIFQVLVDAE